MLLGRSVLVALTIATGCKKGNDNEPPAKPTALPATPWEEYASKNGAFTIALPSQPIVQEQGEVASVAAEFGMSSSDPRTSTCGVAYSSLGDASTDPKAVLDRVTTRDKQNRKVIEEKDVMLGMHPGRSLIVDTELHRMRKRVYVVGATLYVLTCGGPLDRAARDEQIATKTLVSFALAK